MKKKGKIKLGFVGVLCGVMVSQGIIMPNMTLAKDKNVNISSAKSRAYVANQVLIRYKNKMEQFKNPTIFSTDNLKKISGNSKSSYMVVTVPSNKGVDETINMLKNNPNIESAQPNYIYSKQELTLDPYVEKYQWGLMNNGQTIKGVTGTKGMDTGATKAWGITQGDPNVFVAVVDTGIDINHKDLKDNIVINTKEISDNGIDDDNNGYIDDVYGWNFYNGNNKVYIKDNNPIKVNHEYDHGTHVAGIIAAEGNGIGTMGVAPNVKILPIKALGGPNGEGTTDQLIQGIQYAQKRGAKIINASWGYILGNGEQPDMLLKQAIQNCGALMVAAAGNNGSSIKCYPAAYDLSNVISVGYMDSSGEKGSASNYGSTVDVFAPGALIESTLPKDFYGYQEGTSMAAPFVSGIAALLYSTGITSPTVIRNRIISSSTQSAKLRPYSISKGYVSAYRSLLYPLAQTSTMSEDGLPLKYIGTWKDETNTQFLGKKQRYSSTKGSTIEFSFKGSSLRWLGTRDKNMGIAEVTIDGKAQRVDLYSKNTINQTLVFYSDRLTPGVHKVTIAVTGEKNPLSQGGKITLDSIQVDQKDTPIFVSSGVYQENHPFLQYSGIWKNTKNIKLNQKSAKSSKKAQSKLTFYFVGQRIDIIGNKGKNYGKVKITVDGVSKVVDLYATKEKYKSTMISSGPMDRKLHKIEIEVLESKNKKSKEIGVLIDYVKIVK